MAAYFTGFKILAFAFFGGITTLATAQTPLSKIGFQPRAGKENKPMQVALFAQTENPFACNSEYPFQEVLVDGNTITLRYVHEYNDAVDCAVMRFHALTLFAPVFEIPPLKAGEYKVMRNLTHMCLLQDPPRCRIPEIIEEIGTLKVVAEEGQWVDYWYFEPGTAKPSEAFDFSWLNPSYGNCNYSFTNDTLHQFGNILNFSFATHYDPDRVCIVDIHPHGPTFAMKGLEQGNYTTYFTELPPCAVCAPGVEICAICDIYVAPMFAGLLKVGEDGAPIGFTPTKEASPASFKVSPGKIELRGLKKDISFERAALVDASGRRYPLSLQTGIGPHITLTYDNGPSMGFYHLILEPENGSPVVLKLAIPSVP